MDEENAHSSEETKSPSFIIFIAIKMLNYTKSSSMVLHEMKNKTKLRTREKICSTSKLLHYLERARDFTFIFLLLFLFTRQKKVLSIM